ncbi:septation protein SepH [uncultured Nocardioides sp.]|uniref:septation protein SepH n=1 Tax=uncultured Nocardioides sp. TaxID=198441 RepID=UPI002618250F|nr:septation protein SepH [uncultured Nocardioides sp.]
MDRLMVHLTLAGTSEDGKRLLLVSDAGEEHTLDVDARLRSALRGETSRLGQLEITMESVLRPRDIQARIRAGETPEAVAEAAQTSVEKIMPFAGPVLAEREHVAQRAQRSSVRRRNGDGARILGEAVESHLRSVNVGADTVAWDAWRREDGRWVLTADFATQTRSGTGTYTYDMPGNYVVAEDDDARWLIGDRSATPAAPPAPDDLEQVRRRRAAALDEPDQLPLGDDAIHLVAPESLPDLHDEAPNQAPGEAVRADAEPGQPEPAPSSHDEPAPAARETTEPPAAQQAAPEHVDEPAARKPARKRGRASVPSWDEIMFGGSKE